MSIGVSCLFGAFHVCDPRRRTTGGVMFIPDCVACRYLVNCPACGPTAFSLGAEVCWHRLPPFAKQSASIPVPHDVAERASATDSCVRSLIRIDSAALAGRLPIVVACETVSHKSAKPKRGRGIGSRPLCLGTARRYFRMDDFRQMLAQLRQS